MPTRKHCLAAAGVCLLLLATLATLVLGRWGPLQRFDTWVGGPAEAWTLHHPGFLRFFLDVESAFSTVGTAAYLLLMVVALLYAGHRRAAWWAVAVVVGAFTTTNLLKIAVRRSRPIWTEPVHALSSFSFPSGHATQIGAGMGVAIVLTWLFVARARLRQVLITIAAGLIVLVGADRVLLGVHNVSDVLGGYAVAGVWLFGMLAVYPPVVRTAEDRAPEYTST